MPNAQDRCPLTRRGPDLNHDGCGDPRSRISVPRSRGAYAARLAPAALSGSATGDTVGVEEVRVAVGTQGARQVPLAELQGHAWARGVVRQAALHARKGTGRWTLRVRIRGRGSWAAAQPRRAERRSAETA